MPPLLLLLLACCSARGSVSARFNENLYSP